MMKRTKFVLMLTLALVLALLLPAAALAGTYAEVRMSPRGGSLYLRSGPSRDSGAVDVVHDGDEIEVLSYGSVWSRIRIANGKKGYIKNLYIDDGDDDYASGTTFVSTYTAYTTASVNLRAGASTDTSVMRTLSRGTKVTVRGKNGGFFLVQTGDGTQGYCSKSYISTSKPGGSSGQTPTRTVTASYVNVRAGGGMSYRVLAVLPRGTRVSVLRVGNYWTMIRYKSIEGWIKNVYLA